MDSMLFINRIVQGGIYFLTLPEDGKNRPYVVISKDNGYGLNVLVFPISSKYADSRAALPILLSNRISFMRTSAVIEVSPKTIIAADFGGLVSPEILSYGINLFVRRFMSISGIESIDEKIQEYLKLLQKEKYALHENPKIQFHAEKFKNNTLLSSTMAEVTKTKQVQKYPFKINDWSLERLKRFRVDMFKLPDETLMKKYQSSPERLGYLKSHIKGEIKKRKEVQIGHK